MTKSTGIWKYVCYNREIVIIVNIYAINRSFLVPQKRVYICFLLPWFCDSCNQYNRVWLYFTFHNVWYSKKLNWRYVLVGAFFFLHIFSTVFTEKNYIYQKVYLHCRVQTGEKRLKLSKRRKEKGKQLRISLLSLVQCVKQDRF